MQELSGPLGNRAPLYKPALTSSSLPPGLTPSEPGVCAPLQPHPSSSLPSSGPFRPCNYFQSSQWSRLPLCLSAFAGLPVSPGAFPAHPSCVIFSLRSSLTFSHPYQWFFFCAASVLCRYFWCAGLIETGPIPPCLSWRLSPTPALTPALVLN